MLSVTAVEHPKGPDSLETAGLVVAPEVSVWAHPGSHEASVSFYS